MVNVCGERSREVFDPPSCVVFCVVCLLVLVLLSSSLSSPSPLFVFCPCCLVWCLVLGAPLERGANQAPSTPAPHLAIIERAIVLSSFSKPAQSRKAPGVVF